MSSYVCRLVSDETKKACWLVTALPEGLKLQQYKIKENRSELSVPLKKSTSLLERAPKGAKAPGTLECINTWGLRVLQAHKRLISLEEYGFEKLLRPEGGSEVHQWLSQVDSDYTDSTTKYSPEVAENLTRISEATDGPSYVLAQVKVKFFLFWFSSVRKKIQKIQNGSVERSSNFRYYRKKVMKLLSVEMSCFLATEEEKSEIKGDLLDLLAFRFESGLMVCPNDGTHLVYVGIAEEEVRSSFDFRSEVEIEEEISLKVFYNHNGTRDKLKWLQDEEWYVGTDIQYNMEAIQKLFTVKLRLVGINYLEKMDETQAQIRVKRPRMVWYHLMAKKVSHSGESGGNKCRECKEVSKVIHFKIVELLSIGMLHKLRSLTEQSSDISEAQLQVKLIVYQEIQSAVTAHVSSWVLDVMQSWMMIEQVECSRIESRASGEAGYDSAYFSALIQEGFFDSSFSAHEENQRSTRESSLQEKKKEIAIIETGSWCLGQNRGRRLCGCWFRF
ncbi:hypothetical protein F2Q68_00032917 [Brassica cretica]|uniref:Uncharacterized protein n=1 Tax=Brassica cretica TaxID=69181 RepID=A0A8S9GDK8_BRACR|nr:hypothetical protein F2Q68_00032917 [Brassica cretica]